MLYFTLFAGLIIGNWVGKSDMKEDNVTLEFKLHQLYRTRDGRKAQILMLDNGNGMMVGAILNQQGWWISCMWDMTGSVLTGFKSSSDLVSEWREPRTVTFNAYVFDHTFTEYAFPFVAFQESGFGGKIKVKITVEEVTE